MIGRNRAIAKILILVTLAIITASYAIGPGGLVSHTPETRVGVHSVLAFWLSISAALVLHSYVPKRQRANIMFLAALAFLIIIHIGSAALNIGILTQEVIERSLVNSVIDLTEVAIFGLLLNASFVCFLRQKPEQKQKINRALFPVAFIVPIAIYGALSLLIYPTLTDSSLIMISWFLGALSIISLLSVSFIAPRIKQESIPLDFGFLISSFLMLIVSVFDIILKLSSPDQGWELAETLQMAAYLVFCLGLGVPFIKRSGFSRLRAYGFLAGMILISYFPFLITIAIESMGLNAPIEFHNLLAYVIIHIGAGLLSGMMAILLYIYPKKPTSWNHYPLVLTFGLWASVSLVSILAAIIYPASFVGELLTPYTVGSILTLCLLIYAIWWTINPPIERRVHPSFLRLSVSLSLFISLIVVGEIVNQVALSLNVTLLSSPIGSIIIQVSNLIIWFAFSFLIFLLAAKSRGAITIEIVTAVFLAMWILPNILKSFYHIWSTGWWVSEIYLFACVLAGTPLLAWLYVRTTGEVTKSHAQTAMYADLLMHDITNFNQMIMTTFELLGADTTTDKQRIKLAEDGCYVVSLAEQLISNVRLLSDSDLDKPVELSSMNLVSVIVKAIDQFGERMNPGDISIEFNPTYATAMILANDQLVHVFLNILYSILESQLEGGEIRIETNQTHQDEESFWHTKIIAACRVDSERETYSSGILGIATARAILELLQGKLSIEEIEIDSRTIRKIYIVTLPSA